MTARHQFQATDQPVSRTQASDAMTSRLPSYEAKCVQRRCFQWGLVPLRSDIKVKELPPANIHVHRVSKNVPPLACYNFDAREWILIIFGRNVTDKVGNQKTLYYATANNLCFCTTSQNGETWKSHFSLNCIVLHTQCTCALSSWKKKLSSVMCLIDSNICWDIKISEYCPLTFTPGLTKNNLSHTLHSDLHSDRLR